MLKAIQATMKAAGSESHIIIIRYSAMISIVAMAGGTAESQ
jgi:hypothetical protein